MIGTTYDEMGGSIYLENLGQLGSSVPQVNFKTALKTYRALQRAVMSGAIASLHDCSEGGLGVALAEMAMAGGLGATVLLKKMPFKGNVVKRDDVLLFSESNSRFIAEVPASQEKALAKILKGIAYAKIGTVEATEEIVVYGLKDQPIVNARAR